MTGIRAEAGTAAIDETPGHDLEGDAGLGERERFLAAAAEDERVAALEPHDVEPRGAVGHEQARHRLLLQPRPRDHEGVVGRLVDELLCDERVGDERRRTSGRARARAR